MSKLKSIREIEMEKAAQPNFGKGISVASGFDLGAKAPLDSRLTVKTLEERNAHVTSNRAYEGMLVYVEADKKTYQLISNAWVEFGFNEEKFQQNIQPIINKNTEQDNRLKTLEDLVVGGEGEGLETIIADVAANKVAIAKETEDRTAADTELDNKISALDAAYKNADTTINNRLDALQSATADLGQIRTDIEANESAITKEVSDRTTAVSAVDGKITAEVNRATIAEKALSDRLDIVEGTEEVEGSIAKALADAKADAAAKSAQALNDAKAYTDEKVLEANTNITELEKKVEANKAALDLVDGKISTAKSEAIQSAKTYTDGEIGKIDTAYKAADVKTLNDSKAYADTEIGKAKTALESSISSVDGKVTTLTGKVTAAEGEIANLKEAVTNKNNNTIVVETEAEISTANENPKVGDLAFVINSKRAYIYKGPEAVTAKNAPEGWVVFDEITNELDLVKYLKKEDAETLYRKKADKIAEADLATELAAKINSKLDANQVDSKISAAVTPVSEKTNANESAINKEIADRKGEITRVEGLVTTSKNQLNSSIEGVDTKVDNLSTSLTEKESALKAEDVKLNNRINKFAPVVSSEQPEGTEVGHV